MVVPIKLASRIRLTGCATGVEDSSNGDTPSCGVQIVPLTANHRQISYNWLSNGKTDENQYRSFSGGAGRQGRSDQMADPCRPRLQQRRPLCTAAEGVRQYHQRAAAAAQRLRELRRAGDLP